jgi:hypothetical protein
MPLVNWRHLWAWVLVLSAIKPADRNLPLVNSLQMAASNKLQAGKYHSHGTKAFNSVLQAHPSAAAAAAFLDGVHVSSKVAVVSGQ